MVNGFRKLLFHTVDLTGQHRDAGFQFSHRKGVEILLDQQAENVALRAAR